MIELSELLAATAGQLQGEAVAQRFSAFAYDTRLLPPRAQTGHGNPDDVVTPGLGPMFVAVKTEKGDGHDYIADAVARGASGVLCQHPPVPPVRGVTCVIVPDSRAALIDYARHVLHRSSLTTVAITGSTGKTTAKELIAATLARAAVGGAETVFSNRGSINGRYGLSIAAGELAPHHRLAVLELAADSFDEIRDLAALTRPRVGVLTAISEAHLASFGSLAAIAEEKGRLLEALPPDGLAVLNADDPRVMALAGRSRAPVITVGESPQAHWRAVDVRLSTAGIEFVVQSNAPEAVGTARAVTTKAGRSDVADAWSLAGHVGTAKAVTAKDGRAAFVVRSPLLGRHHVPLLLTAVALGRWFGLSEAEIGAALAAFQPLPGHLRLLPGRHGSLVLDDTVNASPAAMLAALETLALFVERPRVAVLGDMWELGVREVAAHRQVGERAADVVDWLVVKGERAQEIANGAQDAGLPRERILRAYTDADALRLLDHLLTHSTAALPPVILVKGDRPARLERIVAGLMAEPERAGELLVRQSPGWLQVRPLTQDRPTWVEIDLEAVAGNVRRAQEIVGSQVGICAVLKADGYGHGAVSIARTALNNGARMLAVACLAEAVILRRAAVDAPILVLGYTPAWQARDTVRHNVTATVYDPDVARALSQAAADLNRPARVHVKVDTGMGRLGLLPDQVLPFMQQLVDLPGLIVEGIFTHFSVADSSEPQHLAHTRAQLAVFTSVLARLEAAGIRPSLVHAANSAAMLTQPASHFDMVRLGIALYGLSPSPAVPLPAGFRPVLSWKTQVAQVKQLPPGASISYGNTYTTTRTTRVAVVPVGYADGFRRAPRHWGRVLVRGQFAPIIGRVTMDQTMLDVTDIPGVRQGDEVVLIGRQGQAEITVEQVAEQLGTINYEVVSEILARVSRVV